MHIRKLFALGVSCAAALAFTTSAHAQTVYFDPAGNSTLIPAFGAFNGSGPAFNWDSSTTADWTTDNSGGTAPTTFTTATGGNPANVVFDVTHQPGNFNFTNINMTDSFSVSSVSKVDDLGGQNFITINGSTGVVLTTPAFNVTGLNLTFNNVTIAPGDFTVQGGGPLVLGGGTSYNGTANVENGFLYNVSGGNANESVDLGDNGRFESNYGVTIGNLSGTAGSHIQTDSANAGPVVVTSSTNTSFGGYINANTAGFIKDGSASLTLSGANQNITSTTINAGKLVAANNDAFSTASTGVEVKNGATLQVNNGIVLNSASNVTLDGPTAVFDVGTTGVVGTAELAGNLTASLGATLKFDLNGTSAIDFLTVDGKLTLNGPVTFDFTDLGGNSFVRGQLYEIISGGTSDFTGFSATVNGPFGPNGIGTITTSGNNVYVEFEAVPEPSTWAFLSIGLALVVVMRLRVRASQVA